MATDFPFTVSDSNSEKVIKNAEKVNDLLIKINGNSHSPAKKFIPSTEKNNSTSQSLENYYSPTSTPDHLNSNGSMAKSYLSKRIKKRKVFYLLI